MEAYKKILVPLDQSRASEAVLPEIEKVGSAETTISLLYVMHLYNISGAFSQDIKGLATGVAQQYLRGVEERLKAKGFKVESHIRYGDEAEEILNQCVQSNCDLIMMSTHGRSGVKRWILGSMAERVLRHTKKPALLVRSTS